MKLAVTYPDVERLTVDYLTPLLDASVGVGVPGSWTPSSGDHVQVALDGTFLPDHPVGARCTVRLVAWSSTTTKAKALVQLAQGWLLAHPGGDEIAGTRPLTGLIPGRDARTGAEIASVTVRVTVRSVPIDES